MLDSHDQELVTKVLEDHPMRKPARKAPREVRAADRLPFDLSDLWVLLGWIEPVECTVERRLELVSEPRLLLLIELPCSEGVLLAPGRNLTDFTEGCVPRASSPEPGPTEWPGHRL